MVAVIMAGGKGTRVASVDSSIPKPLLPVNGEPVLLHEMKCLRRQGITDVILVVGHMGGQIVDRFGDGRQLGMSIRYIHEETPLGTAGALYYLKNMLHDDFLLLNGDLIFDVDFSRIIAFHRERNAMITLFVHPNEHPADSVIVKADSDGRVCGWLTKEDRRTWYKNRVNAGLHVISPRLLRYLDGPKKVDLDRDLIRPLIATGEVYAYHSPEYVKDMGTPERIEAVERDIRNGLVQMKNLSRKQRAIFLDRDGTINKYVGFLRSIDDFELLDGVAEAVRAINRSGCLAIVVTNQPVIARGEVTWEELDEIDQKMETLLGQEGAYIDDIFICPHHPDRGFAGERPEYKIECDCRKPKPGLLLRAAEKYNIDLAASWMIGDADSDVKAGEAAGCRAVKIGGGVTLADAVREILSKASA